MPHKEPSHWSGVRHDTELTLLTRPNPVYLFQMTKVVFRPAGPCGIENSVGDTPGGVHRALFELCTLNSVLCIKCGRIAPP